MEAPSPTAAPIQTLLGLIRSPQDLIYRVQESVVRDDGELRREVDVSLNCAERQKIFFDALRPPKGRIINFAIEEGPDGIRKLDHEEHVEIGRELLLERWIGLAEKIVIHDSKQRENVQNTLVEAFERMLTLPALGPKKAEAVLEDLWSDYSRKNDSREPNRLYELECIRKMESDVSVDTGQLRLLFLLCKLLAFRYLVILEIPIEEGASRVSLSYSYSQPIIDNRVGVHGPGIPPGAAGRTRKPAKPIRARVRRALGAAPNAFQVHVPLIKRARHYDFTYVPPTDYFASEASLVFPGVERSVKSASSDVGKRHRRNSAKLGKGKFSTGVQVGSEVQWALSMAYGQRVLLFARHVPPSLPRISVGIQLMELPGRATFRAWSLTVVAALVIIALEVVAIFETPQKLSFSALIISFIGVASATSQATFPTEGLVGSPVQARLISFGTLLACAFMAVWLISLGVSDSDTGPGSIALRNAQSGNALAATLEFLDSIWRPWGGRIACGAMVTMCAVASRRVFVLMRAYRRVLQRARNREYLYTMPEGELRAND